MQRPSARPDSTSLTRRAAELRQEVLHASPATLAANTGADLRVNGLEHELLLKVWDREMIVEFPGAAVHYTPGTQPAPPATEALVMYYLHTADGSPIHQRWISFADLPDGRFYNQAYQSYTGSELSRAFGNDIEGFGAAAEAAGGEEVLQRNGIGDLAFRFIPLPRVPLLVTCWMGDEDFPSSFQILFDASAKAYLPTDVCAILGSTLTHRILARRAG